MIVQASRLVSFWSGIWLAIRTGSTVALKDGDWSMIVNGKQKGSEPGVTSRFPPSSGRTRAAIYRICDISLYRP